MTRFEQIVASLPKDIVLPPELRIICDALDRNGYPLSGYMRINSDYQAGLVYWFGKDVEMASNFAAFGSGPDGSILAFWLLTGNDTTASPVVHLGSEGTHCFVLARNFHDFVRLLAIGYDEVGFDDLSAPPSDPESATWLRTLVENEFHLSVPKIGAELVADAQANSPSLEQAIKSWEARRSGSTD